jgi:hypothetical protein
MNDKTGNKTHFFIHFCPNLFLNLLKSTHNNQNAKINILKIKLSTKKMFTKAIQFRTTDVWVTTQSFIMGLSVI